MLPLMQLSGRILLVCDECDAVWCDHRVLTAETSAGHIVTGREVLCFEPVEIERRAIAQDLAFVEDPVPCWSLFHSLNKDHLAPSADFVLDHSGYVLSVGGCSVCDQDRVLAWVSASGRLVFRCPDGHEALSGSEGRVFPLWWVPDSEDPGVVVERYANAGDVAAIIAAGGPRSDDDDELALFDVKWAILPRA